MIDLSKAVVLVSGGMDSVTTLGIAIKEGYECYILFVDYNQNTVTRVRESSRIAAERYKATWKEFKLHDLSTITYTSLIHTNGDTEVQGRNAIFICLAVAYAQTIGADAVFLGIQSEDVSYKDAQPYFFEKIRDALLYAYGVTLNAPLLYKNKTEIMKIAQDLNIDLNQTYSCYFNADQPCGECPSCLARIFAQEQFEKSQVEN